MTDYLKKYITRNKVKRVIYAVLLLIGLIYLAIKINFNLITLINGIPSMFNLFQRMFNPNFSYLKEVLGKLLETVQIAIVSSILGVILAIPFSLLTSFNIAPNKFLSTILNGVFAFFRTIPNLIWAAILVSVFSIGKFPGVIALTITAFLISQRLFREYIESINENLLNSTRSVGASSFQTLRFCVLPVIFEMSISTFFMVLETNIRSATVLGFVGAGGIGQIMWRDLNHLRYDNLATLILVLFATIVTIDLLSLYIRNNLKHSSIRFKSIESFRKYKLAKLIIIPIIIIFIGILIINSLEITLDRFLIGFEQGSTIIKRMINMDFAYFPRLIEGMKESFIIAVFATLVGGISAMIISYFTAYNTSPNKSVSLFFKGVTNILRTFPAIITAIIFFRGVGPGPLAGALALSIYTTGVLTKLYSEVLEGAPSNIKNSIIATGGTNYQSYRHGLIPHTFGTFISLMLYRMESNIRTSTILGIIGAGGIGTILSMNITWRNWERVGLLLLGISLMVISIDLLSNYIRKIFK